MRVNADVAELADAPDLGSGATGVQVQVLSSAPRQRERRIVRADFFVQKNQSPSVLLLLFPQKSRFASAMSLQART